MACPHCGEVCHCHVDVCADASGRPRFQVDGDSAQHSSSAILIDPEPYDATEEQFSASLETSASRFVPDDAATTTLSERPAQISTVAEITADLSEPSPDHSAEGAVAALEAHEPDTAASGIDSSATSRIQQGAQSASQQSDSNIDRSPDNWKEEVAARLNSYRARRKPRPPKYPSLELDFAPPAPPAPKARARNTNSSSAFAVEHRPQAPIENPRQPEQPLRAEEDRAPIASGRVIEFPRFSPPQEAPADQLAEPVCERPRILDAPELEFPAPALGGIVLETAIEEVQTDARPGFEIPLRSAPVSRRILAAAVDCIVIAAAGVVFGYIFLKLTPAIPPLRQLLPSAGMVATLLWAGYEYLVLTYSGSTPGLRLAKLRLTHFDGSAVPRSTRRWRVLASILSAVSLGLGFAWCFLDEDALCWHDRITRTHLAPLD